MKVTNSSNVDISIANIKLIPGSSIDFFEGCFNVLNIHSEIGNCVITTEYSKRSFEDYGNLKAKEGELKNDKGMKEIIVFN